MIHDYAEPNDVNFKSFFFQFRRTSIIITSVSKEVTDNSFITGRLESKKVTNRRGFSP